MATQLLVIENDYYPHPIRIENRSHRDRGGRSDGIFAGHADSTTVKVTVSVRSSAM